MIKKAVVISSCLLYLLLSAGVHLNLHTCCGSIVSWTMATNDASKEEKHENCCHNSGCCDSQELHFQIQDDQEIPYSFSWPPTLIGGNIHPHQLTHSLIQSSIFGFDNHAEAPPDALQKLLFIQHHQLLFYA